MESTSLSSGSGLSYQREYIDRASHAFSGLQITAKCYLLAKKTGVDSLGDLSVWGKNGVSLPWKGIHRSRKGTCNLVWDTFIPAILNIPKTQQETCILILVIFVHRNNESCFWRHYIFKRKGEDTGSMSSFCWSTVWSSVKIPQVLATPTEQRYGTSKISAPLHAELVFWELISSRTPWNVQQIY